MLHFSQNDPLKMMCCYAASSESALMSDYVINKPRAVSNDLRLKNDHWPEYLPDHRRGDKVEWVLTANKDYSMKSAWHWIRNVGESVRRSKLVWHRDDIPRCSIILRLTCKDRLSTKDRLRRWGVLNRLRRSKPVILFCAPMQVVYEKGCMLETDSG